MSVRVLVVDDQEPFRVAAAAVVAAADGFELVGSADTGNVQAGADPRHLRLGDPGIDPQRADKSSTARVETPLT